MQAEPLGADLHDELTVDDVEPFVLVDVEVSCWSAPGVKGVFEHQQALAAGAGDLELDGADTEFTHLVKAISPGRHAVNRLGAGGPALLWWLCHRHLPAASFLYAAVGARTLQ